MCGESRPERRMERKEREEGREDEEEERKGVTEEASE